MKETIMLLIAVRATKSGLPTLSQKRISTCKFGGGKHSPFTLTSVHPERA